MRSFASFLLRHPLAAGVSLVFLPTAVPLIFLGKDADVSLALHYSFYGGYWFALIPTWVFLLWFSGSNLRFREQFTKVVAGIDSINATIKMAGPSIRNWWLMAAATVVPLGGTTAVFLIANEGQKIRWLDWVPQWITSVPLGINTFVLLSLASWISLVLRSGELKIVPLHPDRSGGLGFVGDIFMAMTVYLVFFGLFLMASAWFLGIGVSVVYGHDTLPPPELVGIFVVFAGIYVAVVIFSLVLPYRRIRTAMRKPRDRILKDIAGEVDRLQGSLPGLISTKAPNYQLQLQHVDEELQRLRNLHQAVQATYPISLFSIGWLRGLQVSTLLPLLVGAAAIANELRKGDG